MADEKTLAQVYGSQPPFSDDMLPRKKPHSAASYRVYREMRDDPTINLARILCVAPIVASGMSVDANDDAPEGARELIEKCMLPMSTTFLKSMLEGMIDFGWQPFEVVWQTNDDGTQVPSKIKGLIHEYTDILVDEKSGEYLGLRQEPSSGRIDLDDVYTLCVTNDLEGTDFYGRPVMQVARGPYEQGKVVDKASDKYDAKIAGTKIVCKYPVGTSKLNGIETDNYEISVALEKSLTGSGFVSIPKKKNQYGAGDESDSEAWELELLSDTSNARGSFIERQKYLDALKVRSFGLPERSVLEGEFGTKAEAEAHAVFAIVNMELRGTMGLIQTNLQLVNRVLRNNYGPAAENTVWLQLSPLSDAAREFLKQVYMTILTNPDAGLVEQGDIDVTSVRDRLGVPSKPVGDMGVTPDGETKSVLDPAIVNSLMGVNPASPTE